MANAAARWARPSRWRRLASAPGPASTAGRIDLKNDLDDVAALACALDLTVGFSNASFNLAAATGAPAWLLTLPDAWARLGEDAYPWYSQVRAFWPAVSGDWPPLMQEVAQALTDFAAPAARLQA